MVLSWTVRGGVSFLSKEDRALEVKKAPRRTIDPQIGGEDREKLDFQYQVLIQKKDHSQLAVGWNASASVILCPYSNQQRSCPHVTHPLSSFCSGQLSGFSGVLAPNGVHAHFRVAVRCGCWPCPHEQEVGGWRSSGDPGSTLSRIGESCI